MLPRLWGGPSYILEEVIDLPFEACRSAGAIVLGYNVDPGLHFFWQP